ncbi:hypothetical protein SAMN05421833_12654 [Microbispora rosea]|uniref:Uncharacterized protein n=1 Tax=Microbispora rosea TaxID=58117 RepID=A0A1N7G5Q0_9ACTN|nr:hypothetical protein Mro03_13900 [Microbispora rosea subsp. rosea]SIS07878.1 hypothetical protein SAMN05421833_12654 [Microbispora rosea]
MGIGSPVRIPGAGHMIGFERPGLVNRELAALIERAAPDLTPGRSKGRSAA